MIFWNIFFSLFFLNYLNHFFFLNVKPMQICTTNVCHFWTQKAICQQNCVILMWCANIFNRPGVAGAVLQIPSSFINWLIKRVNYPFPKISAKHLHSPTRRARDLKFRWNFHLPLSVTCHVSHVTCHVSHVICSL